LLAAFDAAAAKPRVQTAAKPREDAEPAADSREAAATAGPAETPAAQTATGEVTADAQDGPRPAAVPAQATSPGSGCAAGEPAASESSTADRPAAARVPAQTEESQVGRTEQAASVPSQGTRADAAEAALPTAAPGTTRSSDESAPASGRMAAAGARAEAEAGTKVEAEITAQAEITAEPEAAEPRAEAAPRTVDNGTTPAPRTDSSSVPAPSASAGEPPATRVPAQAAAAATGTQTPEPAPASVPDSTEETTGAPALSLTKIEASAPGLVDLCKSAGSAVRANGLAGQRAAVYLVLDRSGSMRRYYKDGTVQHLAEQALALSTHLDDDGTVPVVFFSTDIDGTAEISLDAYEGRIEALHADLGHMGRTNYHRAVEAVVEHYEKSGSTAPALVLFQTDGAPTSKPAAEKALCEAAKLPVFWQFIGFGDPGAKGFDFLRKLDDLAVPDKRPVDNAGFFHAGLDPLLVSDDEVFAKLTAGFPAWLGSAREAGIAR
jgi:hypothetical protein